jgi:hypothetical protein
MQQCRITGSGGYSTLHLGQESVLFQLRFDWIENEWASFDSQATTASSDEHDVFYVQ